jgi:hypothetical protein
MFYPASIQQGLGNRVAAVMALERGPADKSTRYLVDAVSFETWLSRRARVAFGIFDGYCKPACIFMD